MTQFQTLILRSTVERGEGCIPKRAVLARALLEAGTATLLARGEDSTEVDEISAALYPPEEWEDFSVGWLVCKICICGKLR